MASKKSQPQIDSNKEILEGVDAIGTIVEEDLDYLKKRFAEFRDSLDSFHSEFTSLKMNQKTLESNQIEIQETLKFLTDKLVHLEVRISTNQPHEKAADDIDDDR